MSTAHLRELIAGVKTQHQAADQKGAALATIAGIVAAGSGGTLTVALGTRTPLLVVTAAATALLLSAAAMWPLLLALQPNIGGRYGFVRWANLETSALLTELGQEEQATRFDLAAELAWQSMLAVVKYRRERLATSLLRATLVAPAVAAVVTAVVQVVGFR